jgi:hypothetical protein
MTALIISANANASSVNIGSIVADRISSDTLKYEMRLNDKMKSIRRSFNLDDKQSEFLYDVQKNVEDSFAHLNEIKDDSIRKTYLRNVLDYWNKNSYIAFSSSDQNTNYRNDYRRYMRCVQATLTNNNISK